MTASASAEDMDGGTNAGPNPAREGDVLTYAGSTAAVELNLISGTGTGGFADGDTFRNFETYVGSAFGDRFYGGANGEQINGGGGRDTYYGSAGADTFVDNDGGTFDYSASKAPITIESAGYGLVFRGTGGDAEGDLLSVGYADGTGYNPLEVIGTSGADRMTTAGWVRATFWGGDGDDFLTGNIGSDILMGGAGRDTIAPGGGADYVDFGPGGGTLVAGGLYGYTPIHTMGSGYLDLVDSNSGQFYLRQTILGDYDTWSGAGNVTGTNAAETFNGAGTVHAGGGNDVITGAYWLNQFYYGEDGDDVITPYTSFQGISTYVNGGNGNDVIHAESAGGAVIEGGAGADRLYAGGGVTVTYGASQAGVTLSGGIGHGGDAEGDVITGSYSHLYGSNQGDYIDGPNGAMFVHGAGGDDYLVGTNVYGDAGNDTIVGAGYGGDGNDLMLGNDMGYNNLYGEAGNDTLRGFRGDDYLNLGTGVDNVVYARGDGYDQVFGFNPGEDHLTVLRQTGYDDHIVYQEALGSSATKVVLAWTPFGGGTTVYDQIAFNSVQAGSMGAGDFLFA